MTERSATGEWPAAAAELPTLPGYEVLAELGRGGMGVVYKARQINPDRLVALKLIRDGALAGPQDRARFRIEAEAVARLRHPNVISVYEVGEHQGQPYFAMEFVAGRQPRHASRWPTTTRPARRRAGPHARPRRPARPRAEDRPPRSQAGEHPPAEDRGQRTEDRGQKHADSLLLCPSQDDRLRSRQAPRQRQHRTDAGRRRPGHAQLHGARAGGGRVGEIGPATDVYALGAILYELLTGRPPFQADSWNRTVEQVLHDEPAPPTRLQPDVPRDLETICLKCLEKEPGRRYANAQALADDLGRFLTDQPVAAVALSDGGAAGAPGRARRLPDRRRESAADRAAPSTAPCSARSSSRSP